MEVSFGQDSEQCFQSDPFRAETNGSASVSFRFTKISLGFDSAKFRNRLLIQRLNSAVLFYCKIDRVSLS